MARFRKKKCGLYGYRFFLVLFIRSSIKLNLNNERVSLRAFRVMFLFDNYQRLSALFYDFHVHVDGQVGT